MILKLSGPFVHHLRRTKIPLQKSANKSRVLDFSDDKSMAQPIENVDTALAEIRKQFEDHELMVIDDTICVLAMDESGVFTCNCIPLTDEIIKSVPIGETSVDKVRTRKINQGGPDEYAFSLNLAPKDYFGSRERLDTLVAYEWELEDPVAPLNGFNKVPTFTRISFRDALKACRVEPTCNMEYYFQRPARLEKDLGRPLQRVFDVKELERELFYKLNIQLFGKCDDDRNNDLMLTNFRILFSDGNDLYATAERGNNYYIFYFITS
ncbi:hypothetical protein ACOME3_008444 [Neoechinorhynchus agilis]